MHQEMPIETMFADEFKTYRSTHREREYLLVDVRQESEYRQEHIPGAMLIPLSEIEQRLGELSPDKDLLFYCRSGQRSQAAATLVRDSGMKPARLVNLRGGITAWDGAVLSDIPRIGIMEHTLGYEETLYQAMNMEKGAFLLYRGLSVHFPDAQPGPALRNLEEMEERHAEAVFEMLDRATGIKEQIRFDDLFASLPGDIVEGGRTFDFWLDHLSASEFDDSRCLLLAETALGLELAAYDLYRTLADRAQTLREQRDFLVLAEQEKGHVRILSKVFRDCLPEEFEE
ncbi:MAG TPA: rhodanese-like domain-containing protein [Desulfomicrobiaceae bacterium]|nr:rhodanese-like domain-containing protein [Desulfomicrobiaceae bacterium]